MMPIRVNITTMGPNELLMNDTAVTVLPTLSISLPPALC
jgi:hypothetical protein